MKGLEEEDEFLKILVKINAFDASEHQKQLFYKLFSLIVCTHHKDTTRFRLDRQDETQLD